MVEPAEGREGAKRIEAFSDGVIAILITIMVLEMHAPEEPGLAHLWSIWPIFVAYVLSYAYIAIYWVNHHRMFHFATRVSNALVWSNMVLLFALSLIPFATAYLGEQHFARDATVFYMVILLLPAFAWAWVQAVVRKTGSREPAAHDYHLRTWRKTIAAGIVYGAGLVASFFVPAAGLVCAGLVAIFWFLPKSPLDRLFARG